MKKLQGKVGKMFSDVSVAALFKLTLHVEKMLAAVATNRNTET